MSISVLGICGSPRKGATEYALKFAMDIVKDTPDVETSLITLRGKKINPCIHCDKCLKTNSYRCEVFKDDANEIIEMWEKADAYLVASPVYCMGVTPILSAFFSRLRPYRNKQLELKYVQLPKVGAALTAGGTRHGGQETAADVINNFYLSRGILVAGGGGAYNGGTIWSKDELKDGALLDQVGMDTVETIARRLVEAAKMLYYGANNLGRR
ncbi:MAG: flavodoxin family protein [Zhaonellaceae bacterium]